MAIPTGMISKYLIWAAVYPNSPEFGDMHWQASESCFKLGLKFNNEELPSRIGGDEWAIRQNLRPIELEGLSPV